MPFDLGCLEGGRPADERRRAEGHAVRLAIGIGSHRDIDLGDVDRLGKLGIADGDAADRGGGEGQELVADPLDFLRRRNDRIGDDSPSAISRRLLPMLALPSAKVMLAAVKPPGWRSAAPATRSSRWRCRGCRRLGCDRLEAGDGDVVAAGDGVAIARLALPEAFEAATSASATARASGAAAALAAARMTMKNEPHAARRDALRSIVTLRGNGLGADGFASRAARYSPHFAARTRRMTGPCGGDHRRGAGVRPPTVSTPRRRRRPRPSGRLNPSAGS